MADIKVLNLVGEETETEGTGDLDLQEKANSELRRFLNVVSDGTSNLAYFVWNNNQFEAGFGTIQSGSILSRDKVIESSNGGNKVDFVSGTKNVISDLPVQEYHLDPSDKDALGNITDDQGNTVYDYGNEQIPQPILENDSLTVAGNQIALGGSADIGHGDLTNVGEGDHRTVEQIEDLVSSLVSGGTNVSVNYDDANDILKISSTNTDTQLSDEEVEDIVGGLITSGSGIESVAYDDANNELTIEVLESNISLVNLGSRSHSDLSDSPSGAHHTKYTDEEAQDSVASALSGGDKITVSYDDANDIISVDTSALDTEEVEDTVNNLISGGSNITTNYDDANDTLTISSPGNQLSDEEVQDIVGGMVSGNTETLIDVTYDDANDVLDFSVNETNISHNNIADVSSSDHHAKYTDSEAVTAINNDTDHGSTASHNYFSGSHDSLSNINSDDHHVKTTTLDDLTDSEITEFISNTSGNRPAAGTVDRIFYETDTGRVLYDNGSSWIEVGLSESQISLANLSSRSHADLTNINTGDHRTDEQIEDLVDALVSAGSNITITYDDANDTLTFSATDTDTTYTAGDRLDLSSTTFSGDEQVSISLPHTNYASGLSNEEIYRMELQAGETLVVDRIEFQ
jgi:hypothetical protein